WMTTCVAPSVLSDVSWLTPAICPSCRSSGAATDDAIVSALAPASVAVTWTVGKSTCGSGATGRNGNATMPTNATAPMSRQVATGRRMKGSDRFTVVLLGAPQARLLSTDARHVRGRVGAVVGCA